MGHLSCAAQTSAPNIQAAPKAQRGLRQALPSTHTEVCFAKTNSAYCRWDDKVLQCKSLQLHSRGCSTLEEPKETYRPPG